ncbi:hypothetical protein ACH5RR_038003 [Cinchona calisaya]|uniref:Uncharacterized protein n=1 Tax=Cinchona calisaya TaxID=153742 RepID=A0ABD2YBT2_9GENT
MEGTGPRLSRVYSRYGVGPPPSPPIFNGPVRKWKRKWVPSEPKIDYNAAATAGKRTTHQQQQQDAPSPPRLLLCRWTPLNNSGDSSEPSKRKFRYTPVIVLEEKKKEAFRKLNDEAVARKMNQSRTGARMRIDMPFEKPNFEYDIIKQIKEPIEDQAYFENLDLQL